MTFVTVFNTTDRPVPLDADGREVGGHEWGTAQTTQDAVKDALAAGDLVKVDVAEDGNPLAVAAAARTAALTDRFAALSAQGDPALERLGKSAGLPDLNKTELVRALTFREDIDVPAPKEK